MEHLAALPPHWLFVVEHPPAHLLTTFFFSPLCGQSSDAVGHGMGRQGSGGITVLDMSLVVGLLAAWVFGFHRGMLQLLPNPRTVAVVVWGRMGDQGTPPLVP